MSPSREKAARPLGRKAAQGRYTAMAKGVTLPPHKERLLRITAGLVITYENVFNNLVRTGVATVDDEPKLMLSRLMELAKEIRGHLTYCFDGVMEADDPLSKLLGGTDEKPES